MPVKIPLYPGYPLADLGWSEMRYTAYSFVMPPTGSDQRGARGRR
jgi:hypothetical protein